MYFDMLESTPIGPLLIVGSDDALHEIRFPDAAGLAAHPDEHWEPADHRLSDTCRQLQLYFEGRLQAFDVPLAPGGTAFQQRVWRALCRVPYGQTASYGDIARTIGQPTASRAVGLANGRNPIPIIIPCHRIIGSSGKLVGYGGGLPIKRALLEREGVLSPAAAPQGILC